MRDTAILQGIGILGGVALLITHAVTQGDGVILDSAFALLGFGVGSVATEKVVARRTKGSE